MDRTTGRQWVVLLEAADEQGHTPIDAAGFSRLIDSWVDSTPTTLYSPNRYAVQVSVGANSPPLALSSAMWSWKDALRRAGLPEWDLVRAELLTPDELEDEIQLAERATGADAPVGPAPWHPPDAVEEELLRRALHDGLTGLMSREMFLDDLRKVIAAHAPEADGPEADGPEADGPEADGPAAGGLGPAVHGVVVVGLGRPVAGPSGRAAEDELMAELARRLETTVRRSDSVARVGVDELAVLVEVRSADELGNVAARILERVGAPLRGRGSPVMVTASLGGVMTSYGDDPDVLMRRAEQAMRMAKEAGGGYTLLGAEAEPGGGGGERSAVRSSHAHASGSGLNA